MPKRLTWYAIKGNKDGKLENTNIQGLEPTDEMPMVQYNPDQTECVILVRAYDEQNALSISRQILQTAKKAWGKDLGWHHELLEDESNE